MSTLEWAQLIDYVEQYLKSFGTGFDTQYVDFVPGVVLGRINLKKRREELLPRQSHCSAGPLTIAESIQDIIADLPTVKIDC